MEYKKRLKMIGILVLGLITIGTTGFMLISHYGFIDALYMTIITLSTVGYMEVRELGPWGRVFTMFVIVAGILVVAYSLDAVMEFLIEAQSTKTVVRRRHRKLIKRMSDHYIICGFGRMGQQIAREFMHKGAPFVVMDSDDAAGQKAQELDIFFVHGDATQDRFLHRAGIEKAKALIAVLGSDPENVYVTLSAKQLNPNLYVVCRAANFEIEQKLLRAGADKVVSPYVIGGRRIASAVLSPTVADFLDNIMYAEDMELHLDEIRIPAVSAMDRLSLRDTRIRRLTNCIIIAIKRVDGAFYTNPRPEDRVFRGDILLALGTSDNIARLRELVQIERLQALIELAPDTGA